MGKGEGEEEEEEDIKLWFLGLNILSLILLWFKTLVGTNNLANATPTINH